MAQMNLYTEKIMEMENRPVVNEGEGVGWSGNLGLIDAKACKLLPLEWISSGILLYRTGNISGHL